MNTSYSTEITVAASPDEILATIHNPRSWWSEGITGSAGAAGRRVRLPLRHRSPLPGSHS